ncbi:MAG: DUF4399 domain-containing protein [Halalkalicoccus sp.]|nr:DUF4399 domain-containing protein [Halalkalicoccus sp.]
MHHDDLRVHARNGDIRQEHGARFTPPDRRENPPKGWPRRAVVGVISGAIAASLAGCLGDEDDPDEGDRRGSADTDHDNPDGEVFFVAPEDRATVTSPVEIEMGTEGFVIESVEEGIRDGHGHFHVFVDVECVEPGEPIPSEEGYEHFGDGRTETELDLEPGRYELCLQAGDGAHVAYDLTDRISITVSERQDR